jgi:hypothetical protein
MMKSHSKILGMLLFTACLLTSLVFCDTRAGLAFQVQRIPQLHEQEQSQVEEFKTLRREYQQEILKKYREAIPKRGTLKEKKAKLLKRS